MDTKQTWFKRHLKDVIYLIILGLVVAVLTPITASYIKKSEKAEAAVSAVETDLQETKVLVRQQQEDVSAAHSENKTAATELQIAIKQIQNMRLQHSAEVERLKDEAEKAEILRAGAETLSASATDRAQAAEEILFKAKKQHVKVWRVVRSDGTGDNVGWLGDENAPRRLSYHERICLPICHACSGEGSKHIHPTLPKAGPTVTNTYGGNVAN